MAHEFPVLLNLALPKSCPVKARCEWGSQVLCTTLKGSGEAAISWFRREEEASRPLKAGEETPAELSRRIQLCASRINRDFDVRGLCMEFPGRLDALAKTAYGDRLPK